jgi:hypothetical protein
MPRRCTGETARYEACTAIVTMIIQLALVISLESLLAQRKK